MHFLFNLLRTKGLYMFRALLAHPQETLHKRHMVYCMRIMSVGCGTVTVKLQPCHSLLILYARSIPNAVCKAHPEDEQVMLETCTGFWFSINWTKSALRWFHCLSLTSVLDGCRSQRHALFAFPPGTGPRYTWNRALSTYVSPSRSCKFVLFCSVKLTQCNESIDSLCRIACLYHRYFFSPMTLSFVSFVSFKASGVAQQLNYVKQGASKRNSLRITAVNIRRISL
jgi:hypothetical protein